jgi:CheY-like chemotaxis protein
MAQSLKPVILIAEDNPDDVEMLRRSFQQAGIEATLEVAANGAEAIQYLEGSGPFATGEKRRLPDFVLLDLKMPGKDGFEVLRWVREQPALKDLPIIVLTCSDEIRDVNKAYALGANSFLTKPLDFTDFKNTVYAAYSFWVKHAPAVSTAPTLNLPLLREQPGAEPPPNS